MTKINGAEGMTDEQLFQTLQSGGKLVMYQYCISIFIMTFKRRSDIYLIRPGESAVGKGLVYSLISFLAGWWGIPWGPIYTIGSFIVNFGGGKDVTQDIMATIYSYNYAMQNNQPYYPQSPYGQPQGQWPPTPQQGQWQQTPQYGQPQNPYPPQNNQPPVN